MEATYRRNLHKSYMCIQEQGEPVEEYELRMLEKAEVPHLLKMEIIAAEGKKQYLYDISGKQQLEDYLSGKKIGYEMLWRVLHSIRELCFALPDYLLRESGICLEPEYIYVNLEGRGVYFTYLPCWNKDLPEAFEHYMEQILRRIDHQDVAATELGYQVYQRCMVKNADIQGILEHVSRKESLDRPMMETVQKPGAEPKKFCCENIPEKSRQESFQKNENGQKNNSSFHLFWADHAPWLFQFLSKLKEKDIKEMSLKEKGIKEKTLKEKNIKGKILEGKVLEERSLGKRKWLFLLGKKLTVKEKLLKGQEGKRKIWLDKRQWGEEDRKEEDRKRMDTREKDRKEEGRKEEDRKRIDAKEKDKKGEDRRRIDAKEKHGKGINFSGWEEMGFAMEKEPAHPTEILGTCNQEPKGKLVYQGIHSCEDIWVEGEEFLLGKNRRQAMGIIDAEGVSRLHAKISRAEGIYYLEDLNSTNGTYLNGEPVEYHQKRKLCQGDCIKFGVEEFQFF